MSDARFTRLVELAAKTAPQDRARLALELCDLLTDWPDKYPHEMREPFETLLEKAAREVDGATRRILAERIAGSAGEAPVELLNELFFDAPAELKGAIVQRNAGNRGDGIAADETLLVQTARSHRGEDFAAAFASMLGIEPVTAQRILQDPDGDALAVACKGAHLTRAAFSTLALLFAPSPNDNDRRLSAYDCVPQDGAEGMIHYWRNSNGDSKAA
jgi:hypothetical protein